MFVRVKKTRGYTYLQIVESRREGKKIKQRVLTTEVPHRPGGPPGSDLGTVLEGIGAGSGQATG